MYFAKADRDLTPFTKLTQNGSQGVKCKTIKLLGNDPEENPGDPGFGGEFLDTTPKAQPTKERTDKLDLIQVTKFCFAKNITKRMKR